MDLATLKDKIVDVPTMIPASTKRSLVVPTAILCSEGDFAAFEVGDYYGAIWTSHVDIVPDKAGLMELLNKHEQSLLEFGVNR